MEKKFHGCYVEGLTEESEVCAERVAIHNAISNGYKVDDFEIIAISSSQSTFAPCTLCRKVINIFGSKIIVIFKYIDKVTIHQAEDLI